MQFHAKPECLDPLPLFAKKLQEILGGQFGEISVAIQHLGQYTARTLQRSLIYGLHTLTRSTSASPPAQQQKKNKEMEHFTIKRDFHQ
ncbi:hypothetical protein GI584_03460 [Gracilibacillus salitolerans]|uniref:Uncharacterized protein n=1 Tax=Gracilibacillus salitolerans TaxID=2663022 RepID=A0A5Q2TG84_9BACI|nr:hypothetical protein GI584_03460 [Gracilibacillus salitolerans]